MPGWVARSRLGLRALHACVEGLDREPIYCGATTSNARWNIRPAGDPIADWGGGSQLPTFAEDVASAMLAAGAATSRPALNSKPVLSPG